MSEDDLKHARDEGRRAASEVLDSQAPTDPLRRIAWAEGYGQIDVLREAVLQAKAAGTTWKQVGEVLGMHYKTAQSKFGQPDRWRKYAERQRAKEQGD